jgi:hypothetical protein
LTITNKPRVANAETDALIIELQAFRQTRLTGERQPAAVNRRNE